MYRFFVLLLAFNFCVYFASAESAISVDLKNIPCAPNDFFNIDCNTCYCNLEQTGYLCTENICTSMDALAPTPTTQIPLVNSTEILVIANQTAQLIRNGSQVEANSSLNLPKIDVTKMQDVTKTHPKIFKKGTVDKNQKPKRYV